MIDRRTEKRAWRKLRKQARQEVASQRSELKQRNYPKYHRQQDLLKISGIVFPELENGYHLGRTLDDLADGDIDLPEGYNSFPEYAEFLKSRLKSLDNPVCTTGRAEILWVSTIPRLIKKEREPGEVTSGAHRFLDIMIEEHNRRINHLVLPQRDLDNLQLESFGASGDMAFLAIGSPMRSHQIPGLALSQAKAYGLRDLKDDIRKGVCNISEETLVQANISFPELMERPDLTDTHPVIGKWKEVERLSALQHVEDLNRTDMDWKARQMVTFLTSKVTKICNSNFQET